MGLVATGGPRNASRADMDRIRAPLSCISVRSVFSVGLFVPDLNADPVEDHNFPKVESMIPTEHIHPMIVHFPIVFFLTLAAFDIVAVARRADVTGRSAAGNVSVGLAVLAGLAAVVAYYFGGVALDMAESHGFHSNVAETHESLGQLTTVTFLLWAAVRG